MPVARCVAVVPQMPDAVFNCEAVNRYIITQSVFFVCVSSMTFLNYYAFMTS